MQLLNIEKGLNSRNNKLDLGGNGDMRCKDMHAGCGEGECDEESFDTWYLLSRAYPLILTFRAKTCTLQNFLL